VFFVVSNEADIRLLASTARGTNNTSLQILLRVLHRNSGTNLPDVATRELGDKYEVGEEPADDDVKVFLRWLACCCLPPLRLRPLWLTILPHSNIF
jgi:hypothetical protein